MMVVGSGALASCRAGVIDLLERSTPVRIVRVRLSKPDGVVLDSVQWQVGDRDSADVAAEIVQYITRFGASVQATIVGWSDR
jgi:hypothetical protein